jgi:integrase
MPKYRSTFQQPDGTPFAPLYVNVKIDGGVLRAYWRGPGYRDLPRGGATIPGVRLLRTGRIEASAKFWDRYNWLRYGKRPPDADDLETANEPGAIVSESWDALIAHYRLHNAPYRRLGKKARHDRDIVLHKIGMNLGGKKVAKAELRHLKELLDKIEFGDPTAKERKAREPRPSAAIAYRLVFGMLFDHARTPLGWVQANPIRDIEKAKRPNKDGLATLTEASVRALRAAYPDYASDERALLELGCGWGARAGDLLSLGWKNVEDGMITFCPTKTKESTGAVVTLPVEGEHLLAVLAHRPKAARYFFQAPPKGSNQWNQDWVVELNPKCWGYRRAWELWKGMRETAGITDTDVTLHSMRKYFACRMIDNGARVQGVADALGDTLESAQIYFAKRDKVKGAVEAFRAGLAA